MKTKNRLIETTQTAFKNKQKLFCAFLTLGFPNLNATEQLILQFEKDGVDIIELGFPFSDPMADGPTIQYSSEWALNLGVIMSDAFRVVRQVRKKGCKVPIIFFSYLNPIYSYGIEKFVREAKNAGFDGAIIPDAPPEEEKGLSAICKKLDFCRVFLVAPTTEKSRASLICRESNGFIYYVSLKGVTGARKELPRDIKRNLDSLKKVAHKPVLIGFGVSSPQQSRDLGAMSQGVIVGSAIVEKLKNSPDNIQPAVKYVRQMVRSLKER